MIIGHARRILLGCSLLLATSSAHACPMCDGEGGRQVRAGLFGPDFAPNLLACLAPFPIFLGIVALIHGPPGRGPARGTSTAPLGGRGGRHG